MALGSPAGKSDDGSGDDQAGVPVTEMVEQPAKVMRIGSMIKQLLEEVKSAPLDEASTPSDAELRIAQAQLVGWLEGLFHGIQTALFAQQMAARSQLEQMRRALPPGALPDEGEGGEHGYPGRQARTGGPYL
jgi:hypothetical protein